MRKKGGRLVNHNFKNKAFTLIEIMVVLVIIAVMAALAIPNLTQMIERSHEQDAMMQLRTVHAAEQVYFARVGSFWPTINNQDVDAIKTNLNLNIVPQGMTYNCDGDGNTFTCTAVRDGGGFTIRVTEAALDGTNPCCSAGACPDPAHVCP